MSQKAPEPKKVWWQPLQYQLPWDDTDCCNPEYTITQFRWVRQLRTLILRILSCLVLLDLSWKTGLVNFLFFPSEENVDLCLANVCCMVEERKTLKSYYFHSWFIFCFYPRKGCKSVLGKSYSLEQLKMIMVKVVLTE